MIPMKHYTAVFDTLFDRPVIKKLMDENPNITKELIKELYKKQWSFLGEFLRKKQGYNIDIVGLGIFSYNYLNIPLYNYYKEFWIKNITSKKPWHEKRVKYYEDSIANTLNYIHKSDLILIEIYEKHPQYKEKFKVYWRNVLYNNNKKFYRDTLVYFRGYLEKFELYIPDEIFEKTYTNAKENLQLVCKPTSIDSSEEEEDD